MIYILQAKPPSLSWMITFATGLFCLFANVVGAQEAPLGATPASVETNLVDFSSIKDVLANDLLEESVGQVIKSTEKKKNGAPSGNINKFEYPSHEDFWGFVSEFWLVKNVTLLRWNFEKPDYGIEQVFTNFLAEMGYVEKKFKILLLEGRNVFHLALPSGPGEVILLLSVPFIQDLDLNKLEISILLFENFIRNDLGQLKKKLTSPKLEKLIGSNFKESSFNHEEWAKLQNEYDKIILSSGFSFQEQFEVTTRVGKILGNKSNHFDRYLALLKKIENLTKGNPNYLGYNKIYPSPELQIKWLLPPSKVL